MSECCLLFCSLFQPKQITGNKLAANSAATLQILEQLSISPPLFKQRLSFVSAILLPGMFLSLFWFIVLLSLTHKAAGLAQTSVHVSWSYDSLPSCLLGRGGLLPSENTSASAEVNWAQCHSFIHTNCTFVVGHVFPLLKDLLSVSHVLAPT